MAAAINTYTSPVIFRVTVKATGEVFYAMPSCAGDGSCYRVTKQAGQFVCDCPDCQYRHRECKHIQALRNHLQVKKELAASAPAQKAHSAPAVKSTKANALPYDHAGEGFSIFKPERPEHRYQTLEDEYAARDGYASSDYYQHAYR